MAPSPARPNQQQRPRLPVYLDPETLKALRIRAIEEGESATKLVERLITDYLKTKRRKRDA
jgi:hypothetical protein